MRLAHAVVHALEIAGSMSWKILWALILGFGLSAVVQAVVSRSMITRLLGDDRPKTLALAAGLGSSQSLFVTLVLRFPRSAPSPGATMRSPMTFLGSFTHQPRCRARRGPSAQERG